MVNVGKYTIHGSYGICIYIGVIGEQSRFIYMYIYKSRSSSFLSGTMWNPEISSNLHCWIVQKSLTFWIYSDNTDRYWHKWTLIDIDTSKPEIWTRNLKKKTKKQISSNLFQLSQVFDHSFRFHCLGISAKPHYWPFWFTIFTSACPCETCETCEPGDSIYGTGICTYIYP